MSKVSYNIRPFVSNQQITLKAMKSTSLLMPLTVSIRSLLLFGSSGLSVKIVRSRHSFLLFSFPIFNLFSIFRTLELGLEVIGHTVTSVTSDGVVTTLITRLKKRKQKVLEQSDIIQHEYHMLASCLTHGHLRCCDNHLSNDK